MFPSETTNTLQVFDFSREYAFNPIEAWLLGASPVINGDTPADNVIHTYGVYLRSHGYDGQWPPASIGQNCKDQNGNAVPCPSEQDNSKPSAGTRGYDPPADGQVIPPEARDKKPSLELGVPYEGKSNSYVDDLIKRFFLLVAAIVIIAIALVSLR